MPTLTGPRDLRRWIFLLLALVLLVRLVSLGAYPLFSTTEPRYAEIARKMLETGNWVTPWFDHGVPFWGKPPLSFWGSAATMAVFGVSEFGARLAPFLCAMLTASLFWAWPRAGRPALPLAAALVMFSSLVGFVASGAVMTDMFMALGTSLCMLGFWRAMVDATGRSPWRWVFFAGLAVGLLAKGPVATVITGVALGGWVLLSPRARLALCWQRLPWLRGLALTALLVLPWYLLAEQRTPGFLQYFIVGEHFERFLVSGWRGDLYGAGHAEPRGLIWWFGFGGFLPWTPLLVLALFLLRWRPRPIAEASPALWQGPGEGQYLLAWTIAPLLFFTLARNILEAYVLPGLPAFALLVAIMLLALGARVRLARLLWALALVWPILATTVLVWYPEIPGLRSQKELLQAWPTESRLVYLVVRPLSANFYTAGRAELASEPAAIDALLRGTGNVSLVVEQRDLARLTAQQLSGWKVLRQHAGFTMLHR